MSKKKREKPTRQRTQAPTQVPRHVPADVADSYGEEILAALERGGAPLTLGELRAGLSIQGRERTAFNDALAGLERAGRVVKNRAGSFLAAKRIDVIAGRIEGHRDGHGFLVPDDAGAQVFLPPAEMRQVMHGDRAAVRVAGHDPRGRPAGTIVEVLERSQRRIVGRLHKEHGVLFLVPEDRRITLDILIPPTDAGSAKPGQVATVELIAQPSKHAQPIGRVAEVLGNYTDPGMEIEIALRKFDLPHEFSKQSLAAARAMPEEVRPEDLKGRRDLVGLHLVEAALLAQGKGHVLAHGERVEERPVLEDHGDFLANALQLFLAVVGDVLLGHDDAPRVRLEEAHDVVQRHRLPYPAASQDADRLAGQGVEADVIEDPVFAEGLGDVLELDEGYGRCAHDSF